MTPSPTLMNSQHISRHITVINLGSIQKPSTAPAMIILRLEVSMNPQILAFSLGVFR